MSILALLMLIFLAPIALAWGVKIGYTVVVTVVKDMVKDW